MQKVEGSSPFIRFRKAPLRRGFLLPDVPPSPLSASGTASGHLGHVSSPCARIGPMSTSLEFLYHVFVGIPLCFALVTFGVLFCLTILGLPVGLTLIAAGVKAL